MVLQVLSILMVFTLATCQPVTFENVEKRIVSPGLPSGSITIQYQAKIEVIKPVQLVSVYLKDSGTALPYSLARLPDGLMLGTLDILEPGTYFLSANLAFREDLQVSEDVLVFEFLDSQKKSFLVEKTATLKESLRRK